MAEDQWSWSWGKTESDLVSLYEWLDSEAGCGGNKRRNAWVIAISASYTIGFLVAVSLLKTYHVKIHEAPTLFLYPLGVSTLVAGAASLWYYRGVNRATREHRLRLGSAHSVMWKLYVARWQANIKGTIGDDAALALNEGAYDYLRCRSELRSPVWRGLSPDSAWAQARDKAQQAMEAAMARLVTLIGQGGSPDRPEIRSLLADMRQASGEIIATSQTLAESKGLSGDVSHELRQVLGEMRALTDAHDELMNLDYLG